jgi:PHD/YefM family antitoxin component YafN of YafNO toxin-antitoxin module
MEETAYRLSTAANRAHPERSLGQVAEGQPIDNSADDRCH